MNSYSYNRGEKIGEMLFRKMLHVDYSGHFTESPSWIQIDGNERNILNKLERFYKQSNKREDWNRILKFYNELDYKYLPHSISEYIDVIEDINIKEFKDGLVDYLWDTDFCSYSLDNSSIEIDENIVTVELRLK